MMAFFSLFWQSRRLCAPRRRELEHNKMSAAMLLAVGTKVTASLWCWIAGQALSLGTAPVVWLFRVRRHSTTKANPNPCGAILCFVKNDAIIWIESNLVCVLHPTSDPSPNPNPSPQPISTVPGSGRQGFVVFRLRTTPGANFEHL